MQSPRTYARASLSLVLQLGTSLSPSVGCRSVVGHALCAQFMWLVLSSRSWCCVPCPTMPQHILYIKLRVLATAAWTEQHRDTCRTWQCLSAVPHVVSYAQRRPVIWWYHQLVRHQPCRPICRGRSTSVEQFTASLPLNLQIVLFLQKRTQIVSFWTLILVVTTWIMTMLSALVVVCTIQ